MLRLHDLRVTFNAGTPGAIPALRGIDLRAEDGAFVVIVGPNGSGKSTLFNAITGSVEADSGEVRVAGQDVTDWPEHRRAKLLSRVIANPAAGTSNSLTIGEHLALAGRRTRRSWLARALTRGQRDSIADRLRPLGLNFENRLQATAGSLSPVERQILAMLCAFWNFPQVLLLDDPTASLDQASGDRVLSLMHNLFAGYRPTTLLVTQSLPDAARLGDRLLIMNKGRIVHDLRGPEKRRLRTGDLLAMLDDLRREDFLNETSAKMLAKMYV